MNYNLQNYLPYYRRNLQVALPVMATQAGQVIVQLADNIMVGHLGAMQLAGVSFANAIFMIGMVVAIGFSQGITPLAGQSFGKGDKAYVAKLFGNACVLNTVMMVALCAIMAVVGVFMGNMGQEEIVVKYAREYYYICVISLIPSMVFFSIRFFSEGIGNTINAMWITLGANLLNILLNWIMIFGHWGCPAFGVAGAAYATLISRVLSASAFILLLFVNKEYKPYMLLLRRKKPVSSVAEAQPATGRDLVQAGQREKLITGASLKFLLKISTQIAAQSLMEVFAFSFAAVMVGWLGGYQLAAHQIAQNLSSLTFMIALGIGSAATIRVSHQYGQGNYYGVRMAGKAAVHMSVLLMGTCGIIFIIFNKQIPLIYTNDPQVAGIAWKLIIVMSLYQIFDAIQMASVNALKGLKDITKPLIISGISYYLICLPAAYLLGFVAGLDAVGVWIGLLMGLVFAAVFFYMRFDKLSRKLLN